jgi:hypothetical protein
VTFKVVILTYLVLDDHYLKNISLKKNKKNSLSTLVFFLRTPNIFLNVGCILAGQEAKICLATWSFWSDLKWPSMVSNAGGRPVDLLYIFCQKIKKTK